MKKRVSVIILWGLMINAGCNKSSSDTTTNSANPLYDLKIASLTVPPLDTADVTGLVPLGNLNPTAHVFPSDHMYFYCFTSKPSLEIKSPGNVHVLRISRTRLNAGAFNDHYEYKIALGSENSYMYWDHVSSLSTKLQAAVNNFSGATCEPAYTTGGISYQGCYVEPANFMAAPGDVLGIANNNGGLAGMDMGVNVNGIAMNPLDYFDAISRTKLEAKLSSADGRIKRTAAPLGGEYNYDIAGAAIGNWIKQGYSKFPEDNNLALVKDNITPSIQVFSAGNTLPGLTSGTYYFLPKSSGIINRNFADVKADGTIYCYTLDLLGFVNFGNSIPGTSIIIKMEGNASMSAEKRNCDCSCTPYVFTTNKVSYTR